MNITIRTQKIETVDSFVYLGCNATRDRKLDREINSRLTKAANAFNRLRYCVWGRKTISIKSRLRIFRAGVLSALLYGSETWNITKQHERRIITFYMRCMRTIVDINLGDRMLNVTLLKVTGQPPIENILRRNRLRWFGHANRMMNSDNEPSIVKEMGRQSSGRYRALEY